MKKAHASFAHGIGVTDRDERHRDRLRKWSAKKKRQERKTQVPDQQKSPLTGSAGAPNVVNVTAGASAFDRIKVRLAELPAARDPRAFASIWRTNAGR
jgi:hypothetical protein